MKQEHLQVEEIGRGNWRRNETDRDEDEIRMNGACERKPFGVVSCL